MLSTAIRNRWGLWCGVCLGLWQLAHAHPKGFHKRVTLTVSAQLLTALVVMDVDSGRQCLMLREAADSNRDGAVRGEEVTALKGRLAKLATQHLRVSLSGAEVSLNPKEAKLSLRDDLRTGDGPLSVAVLLEAPLHRIHEGTTVELTDKAPDGSAVAVQIFQDTEEKPFEHELASGRSVQVRIGRPNAEKKE